MKQLSRRRFAGALSAAAGLVFAETAPGQRKSDIYRLRARPGKTPSELAGPGLHRLGLRDERDGLLYIPEAAARFPRAPLVVSLHGATRGPERGIDLLKTLADEQGFLLLAPASEDRTWDAIGGEWGGDAAFINRCLDRTFTMAAVDPGRVAMAGFSDGASCSLSLGLANGDFFSAVFGFSPGFVLRDDRTGKPPVFVSHGTQDPVLPYDQCSALIVPALRREGYQVTFRTFDGKHTLPPDIAQDAMKWFMSLGKPA